jgi:glycine hydroxymethyltransferase
VTAPSMTEQTRRYLEQTEGNVLSRDAWATADRIEDLVSLHDTWRSQCLNMNPAESSISARARNILASDMATRLSEGMPGDKAYPHGRQNEYIDEIEATIIALAKAQFRARYVEWRPVSTTMANAAVFFSMLVPSDTIIVQSEDGGGNFSYHAKGPAGLTGARIIDAPIAGDTFEIDLDRLSSLVAEHKPKMLIVGGSNVLFPYPLRDLREIADGVGAILVYDAAHLGLLVSAGLFQDPLAEGAHIVTVSTHKIMGGPVGGLILTNDEAIAARLFQITFPGFMQTRDQNKFAALAITLAELQQHGPALAQAMVKNARALANGLAAEGFEILGTDRNYTDTHQIFLRLGDAARSTEQRCQAANILFTDCALTGDMPKGLRRGARLATHEITRRGLPSDDMRTVASLIARADRGEDTAAVAADVATLLDRHSSLLYSLDRRA